MPLGRITGLIGPNRAGKTTTFDACSGLNRRIGGQISLRGKELTKVGASARGRLGLGRTFQRMALCDRLTVAENVALGRESGLGGASVLGQLAATRSQRADTRAAAWSAMELCGITELAGTQAGALSTGQRRLVELARCLAGQFDVLILDEPSSGLDHAETEALARILRRTVVERGCGILLVEHDMSLVMNVCEYIYVLDFGELLFEGDPPGVAASPRCRPRTWAMRPRRRRPDGQQRAAASQQQRVGARSCRRPHLSFAMSPAATGRPPSCAASRSLSRRPVSSPCSALTARVRRHCSRRCWAFLRPSSGSILLFGNDAACIAPYRRFHEGLCHVPEGRGVFRSLTVRENLIMQSRKGEEAEAISQACEVFPALGRRIGNVAGTLSGGEQQMLAMATAYVRSPRLIMVDEASLGLAPLVVDQIFQFMEKVAHEGKALLIVDQFATRALALADTAYVLSRGSVTYSGSAKELGQAELLSQYMGT